MPSRTAAFLQDEVDTAWFYRRQAEMEPDQQLDGNGGGALAGSPG